MKETPSPSLASEDKPLSMIEQLHAYIKARPLDADFIRKLKPQTVEELENEIGTYESFPVPEQFRRKPDVCNVEETE